MPCAGFVSAHSPADKIKLNSRKRVVWAGRFSHEKRFEWLIEVAKRLPEIDFDVLGSKNKLGAYDSKLIEQAEGIENIFLRGRVPHEQMGSYYDNSDLLLCTSIYEGFPNTFLEAWSVATPVVTTVDPDNVVERHQLGAKAETVDALVRAISESLETENWLRLSANAAKYFNQYHAIDQAMSGFSNLFQDI
jgi:glycosyltransferase involved in cell wall biosynthesis